MRNSMPLIAMVLFLVSLGGCRWAGKTNTGKVGATSHYVDDADSMAGSLSQLFKPAGTESQRTRDRQQKKQLAKLRRNLPSETTIGRLSSEFRDYIDDQ